MGIRRPSFRRLGKCIGASRNDQSQWAPQLSKYSPNSPSYWEEDFNLVVHLPCNILASQSRSNEKMYWHILRQTHLEMQGSCCKAWRQSCHSPLCLSPPCVCGWWRESSHHCNSSHLSVRRVAHAQESTIPKWLNGIQMSLVVSGETRANPNGRCAPWVNDKSNNSLGITTNLEDSNQFHNLHPLFQREHSQAQIDSSAQPPSETKAGASSLLNGLSQSHGDDTTTLLHDCSLFVKPPRAFA